MFKPISDNRKNCSINRQEHPILVKFTTKGRNSNMAIRILLSRVLGEQRVTQIELARKTGIRPATINEMYHELNDRVNLIYLDRICEVLHCDLSDILVYTPDQRSHKPLNKR